jgi:hypothetical protein
MCSTHIFGTVCNIHIGEKVVKSLFDGYPSYMVPVLAEYLDESKDLYELYKSLSDRFVPGKDPFPCHSYYINFATKEIEWNWYSASSKLKISSDPAEIIIDFNRETLAYQIPKRYLSPILDIFLEIVDGNLDILATARSKVVVLNKLLLNKLNITYQKKFVCVHERTKDRFNVTVNAELRKKKGICYETLKEKDFIVLSINGTLRDCTGETKYEMRGQINTALKEILSSPGWRVPKKLQALLKIWDKYYSNNLQHESFHKEVDDKILSQLEKIFRGRKLLTPKN